MFLGITMIMVQVKSPMLFAVGMYLPLGTTFTIFLGGVVRWIADGVAQSRGYNAAQLTRVENAGILAASGLIAGEALIGLLWSAMQFLPPGNIPDFHNESYMLGLLVLLGMVLLLVRMPLTNAGSPDEPAPPQALI
jgi:hypothetical protein